MEDTNKIFRRQACLQVPKFLFQCNDIRLRANSEKPKEIRCA